MVVPVKQGDVNSIGLVGCSSMRGLYHDSGEGEGTSILSRLYSTFSIWEPKACVGYAYNGHTAMIARVDGVVGAVTGWNPASYMGAQARTMLAGVMGYKNRFTCDGLWLRRQGHDQRSDRDQRGDPGREGRGRRVPVADR